MSLKIDASMSATAYHITDGAVVFPYAVDANQACSSHPNEWSMKPWSQEDAALARKEMVADAKAKGLPAPPEPEPLSAEDRAALDEHNKAVAAAAERLAAYHAKKEAERQEAEQAINDERLVASPAPRPQPVEKPRPLSPAQIRKRAAMTEDEVAKKEADDKLVKDKASADALARSDAKLTG